MSSARAQMCVGLYKNNLLGAGIWPSGQSSGLARWQARFNPRQGRPLYIWTFGYMYTRSAVCILGMDMCASSYLFFVFCFFFF
jgi:hypothetical protein